MSSNSKILITGGHGLVGSACTGDMRLTSQDGDLRKCYITDNIFSSRTPTHVIHCAAKVGGVGGNMNHKGEYFYDNIMMNTNVIHAAHKYDVDKLVAFLSTCVFPDDVEYPLTPDKIHCGSPHQSNDAYSYAKR